MAGRPLARRTSGWFQICVAVSNPLRWDRLPIVLTRGAGLKWCLPVAEPALPLALPLPLGVLLDLSSGHVGLHQHARHVHSHGGARGGERQALVAPIRRDALGVAEV